MHIFHEEFKKNNCINFIFFQLMHYNFPFFIRLAFEIKLKNNKQILFFRNRYVHSHNFGYEKNEV